MAPSIVPERPALAPLCDRCPTARGFKFVMGYWVCPACRLKLLKELESEKGWGGRWL
jgi:rubredoxin